MSDVIERAFKIAVDRLNLAAWERTRGKHSTKPTPRCGEVPLRADDENNRNSMVHLSDFLQPKFVSYRSERQTYNI